VAQILAATPLDKKRCPPIELVEAVDAMINGWLLLLPDSKRPLMSEDGEIDELLFYAHMALHAYVTLDWCCHFKLQRANAVNVT
jgi:hypothetical protein